MRTTYLVQLNHQQHLEAIGSKAFNLRRLRERGFRVPDSFVCTWHAYEDYLQEGPMILDRLKAELSRVIRADGCYAVRSSANVEDNSDYSFAGQFKTILDVHGIEAIVQSIREIWETAGSDSIHSYLHKIQRSQHEIKVAVIIQEMITPVVSGVAFSKNPLTGADEIVVEALPGLGSILVQDGSTPTRWVNRKGRWLERPSQGDIPPDLIVAVVAQTNAIVHSFHYHVDLEWVYDGLNLYLLQARPITTNTRLPIYSNKIAREMSPGMIKPLVWSVILKMNANSMVTVLSEISGDRTLRAEDLTKTFHYRAYHNVSVLGDIFAHLGLPRESLEMMMGVEAGISGRAELKVDLGLLPHLPRLLHFIAGKLVFSGRANKDYLRLTAALQAYAPGPVPELNERLLLDTLDQIQALGQQVSYNATISILLMQVYVGVLKARLASLGIDFPAFNLTEGMTELSQYNPIPMLERLNREYLRLDKKAQEKVQAGDLSILQDLQVSYTFRSGVAAFLQQFGHLSESGNDFGTIPWRETPDLVLKLISGYHLPADQVVKRLGLADLKIKGPSRGTFMVVYRRARQFRLLREMYTSLLTYTSMLLRSYYLALGERLVRQSLIDMAEDVYFLYDFEIRDYVDGKTAAADYNQRVCRRKLEMEASKDMRLPEVIFGNDLPLVSLLATDKLRGTPTSPGFYTGPARVIRRLDEFERLQVGDVLVIPYSDISWTPLFTRAGGVISESGGMLSHSSIIAREFNIPSVVSVVDATRILQDGKLITIDGYKGEILIHADAPRAAAVSQGICL